ncbi:unnamed protein product [Arabidopsis lyrata]|nr:unnamed protein product [Arabidopsis lyrata]
MFKQLIGPQVLTLKKYQRTSSVLTLAIPTVQMAESVLKQRNVKEIEEEPSGKSSSKRRKRRERGQESGHSGDHKAAETCCRSRRGY